MSSLEYTLPARAIVFVAVLAAGWLATKIGPRRWRSGVGLAETRGAFRLGRLATDPSAIRVAVILLLSLLAALRLAVPELFGFGPNT